MPLKTLVKVGTITNLSDARYCSGMGVDMLGFNVAAGTSNFVQLKTYQDIRGWLSGPLFVAEVYQADSKSLASLVENYLPDFLEMALSDLENLPAEVATPLIISVDEESTLRYKSLLAQKRDKIAYLVVRSTASKSFIDQMANTFSTLLIPAEADNVHNLLASFNIKGIVLNGSSEIKAGLKNYDHLAPVLEQLEVE